MALDYVKAGDAVRASTVNQIIDRLGGNECASPDIQFTNTGKGAIFTAADRLGGPSKSIPNFLEARPYNLSTDQYFQYQLGNSIEECLNCVSYRTQEDKPKHPVSAFFVYHIDDEDKAAAITSSDWQKNCLSTVAPTGFIRSVIQSGAMARSYAQFWHSEEDKDYFVISYTEDKDTISAALEEYLEDVSLSSYDVVYSTMLTDRTRSLDGRDVGNIVQLKTGPIDVYATDDLEKRTKFKLRANVEKRYNEDGQKELKFNIEWYNGMFIHPNGEDTGIRWNNHQYRNVSPNLGEWVELTSSEWSSSVSENIDVYLNLTSTYYYNKSAMKNFRGQFAVSLQPTTEDMTSKFNTISLTSTYALGNVMIEGEDVKIKQNIIGEQTNVELFEYDATSAVVDDVLPQILSNYLPKLDSDLAVLQLSSLGRYTHKDEETGKDSEIYELFDFHRLDNQVKLEKDDQQYADIVLRVRSKENQGKPAYVKYLKLTDLSGPSTDAIESRDGCLSPALYSIDYNTNSMNDQKYLELYNFSSLDVQHGFKPEYLNDDTADGKADSIVVRRWTGNGHDHEVQYVGFDCISSFADYKGDSQLSSLDPKMKSIVRKQSDEDGWYYQLYDWTGQHSNINITANYDGSSYDWGTGSKYEAEEDEGYYFLQQHVKTNGERELVYRRLVVNLPELPENPASEEDITNIYNYIDENYWTITEVSGFVLSSFQNLSSSLSDDFWKQGGYYGNCYGVSIGDSSKNLAIWTDDHQLWGDWSVQGNFASNAGNIKAWNFNTWDYSGKYTVGYSELRSDGLDVGGTIKTTGNIDCSGSLSAGGSITIGSTTLTEDKLKKLLKLLENYPSVIDNI